MKGNIKQELNFSTRPRGGARPSHHGKRTQEREELLKAAKRKPRGGDSLQKKGKES